MTFRLTIKRYEDHHDGGGYHHDDEGHHHDNKTFSFKSRHVDKALLRAVQTYLGYRPWQNHPMRYWAIAGWGPVPAFLRAPEGIYRELDLMNPSDLDLSFQLLDVSIWCVRIDTQNIIFVNTQLKVGEVRWVAVIDVRDDTTVENLRIPPQGIEAIACSPEEFSKFRPPIDTATGREYIEMTSGEFVVSDFLCFAGIIRKVVSVGNAAVGKWFWEVYPRRDGSSLTRQLVVWHESVDDTNEYKSPYLGPDDDLINNEMCFSSERRCFEPEFGLVEFGLLVEERKEALTVVETFLWIADAEPQLKHAMAKFMTKDPNLWWKRGELPDGFLLSGFGPRMPHKMFVGELGCEKLCFAEMVERELKYSTVTAFAGTVMGVCAVKYPNERELLSMQFKPSRATGKIVAMRAVFAVKDAVSREPGVRETMTLGL